MLVALGAGTLAQGYSTLAVMMPSSPSRGDTWRALPVVFQAVATTRSYNGSVLRALCLSHFAEHICKPAERSVEPSKGAGVSGCACVLVAASCLVMGTRAIERRDGSGEWYAEASAPQIPAARDEFEA